MITFTKKLKDEFLASEDAVKAASNYLMNNYAITDIVESLAQALINQPSVTRIPLNPDEYEAVMGLFRVRGVREDGTAEFRGRKRKNNETVE